MKCCVPFCEEVSFLHEFPTANEKQCQEWITRIGINQKDVERYRICDRHFEQRCHLSDSEELIPGALPTLLLPGLRDEEYSGCYSMDFLPENLNSSEAIDIIVEGIGESSHLVNVRIDSEVEDVARRYSASQNERSRDESGITINRPEDIEIVTRYAMRYEQDSEEEIILKYPNDDDVIKRYSSGFEFSSGSSHVGVCDKGSSTEPVIADSNYCHDGYQATDHSGGMSSGADHKHSSGNQTETDDLQATGLSLHSHQSPIRTQSSSNTRESDSEMSESNEDSTSDQDASEHPSDDEEEGIHRDPGELNSVSEEFDDSCYDSVDADEALRALMKPGCSSPRNHSITVYNLCCDKQFLSSISIDPPKKDALPVRGTTRHRDFLHDFVVNTPLSNSFQGVADSNRKMKKLGNKTKSKSRNDNLTSVILSLEKIAQNVETKCIEARRSLRKSSSPGSVLRASAKLKGEVTPLLNSQLSLLKKIRTNNVPI